jgi:hypothetical protein
MHFHPGWSGPAEGFGHGGYYTGDGCYEYVDHQQDSKTPRQENQMVQNPKLDGLVSLKVLVAPEQQSEREVLKDRSYVDQLESSQGQTVPMSISSANGEAKPDAERKSEEVVVE